MATLPLTSDLEVNQGFFEVPKNMTNPMEAIATAAISIKSIRPLNHTRVFLSNRHTKEALPAIDFIDAGPAHLGLIAKMTTDFRRDK